MPFPDDSTLSRHFKALAHPRRARLFRLLSDSANRELTFSALQRATGISDTSLVHHLREMERCGILRRRRRGAYVSYALTTSRFVQSLSIVLRESAVARAA